MLLVTETYKYIPGVKRKEKKNELLKYQFTNKYCGKCISYL